MGTTLPDIPDEILLTDVLPRLPAKSLLCCKRVCRQWRNYISSDPALALQQSAHASRGAVYLKNRRLCTLPTPDAPVVPSPSLGFEDADRFRLLASANGLVCLHIHPTDSNQQFLYVCNPLTGEGQCIPGSEHRGSLSCDRASVGLAFDPSADPTHYTLVELLRNNVKRSGPPSVEYGFDIFSSDTGQWVRSTEKLLVTNFLRLHTKVVFAQGVLYWDCDERVLFYHLANDHAGMMMLPAGEKRDQQEIGVWDGRVTLTRVSKEAVEVWAMTEMGGSWERIYRLELEMLVMENRDVFSKFWHTMELTSRKVSEGLTDRLMVRPLPYEGGQLLYLRIGASLWRKRSRQLICCYDLRTGKMEEFHVDGLSELGEDESFFSYHNSLVHLPKIADPRHKE